MRLMKRNLKKVWYCLYDRKVNTVDEDGYETGEKEIVYRLAVEMECNVSPASGFAQANLFGNLDSYDKVLLTDDMDCPIDENTVLFVDKSPEYDKAGKPLYDYRVRRVAKSLNSIAIAVHKVAVS